jgi:hypothetical protein
MKKLMYRVSGLLLIVLLNSAEVLAQCAMCRGSVQSTLGNGRNNVGVGINTGIAYLFVIPYLSVAVIAYFWYRNSRRQLRERQMVAARVRQAMEGTDQ